VIEYNCAASKIVLPVVFQIPIWIFTTAAIRNLAHQRTDPGEARGGVKYSGHKKFLGPSNHQKDLLNSSGGLAWWTSHLPQEQEDPSSNPTRVLGF
jgi:hypothetical protein